jgi:hypothetical protein
MKNNKNKKKSPCSWLPLLQYTHEVDETKQKTKTKPKQNKKITLLATPGTPF